MFNVKSSRSTDDHSTSSSLERLEQAHREFNASFGATLQSAARDAKAAVKQSEQAEGDAAQVRLEYARFRRTIEQFDMETGAGAGAGAGGG